MDALFVERRDFAAVAAIDDADLGVAVDLAHEARAPRAENAAVAVEHQRRAEIHVGADAFAVERAAGEVHPALDVAEAGGEVLQRALATLVADGTVERMIDEQELENTGTRVDRFGIRGVDDHALADGRRARRLQLRHFLDLDEAHTTGGVDPETGVVAVIRDLDAGLDGGLQDRVPLGTVTGRPSMVSVTVSMNRRSYQEDHALRGRTASLRSAAGRRFAPQESRRWPAAAPRCRTLLVRTPVMRRYSAVRPRSCRDAERSESVLRRAARPTADVYLVRHQR